VVEVVREHQVIPAWVSRRLGQAGGLNIFGEPIYRVCWGWDRLSWIGGTWEEHDRSGNYLGSWFGMSREPRYFAVDPNGYMTFNRFFLEKWMPPEHYGPPWRWYESTLEWEYEDSHGGRWIHSLGPFPSRGDYEMCYPLETPNHHFLPLSLTLVEWMARMIEFGRFQPRSKRLAVLRRREERKFEQEVKRNEDILSDVSPFFKGSYVSYSGMDAR
jgi:hypothetical protein